MGLIILLDVKDERLRRAKDNAQVSGMGCWMLHSQIAKTGRGVKFEG